jgi:hypothetical protein
MPRRMTPGPIPRNGQRSCTLLTRRAGWYSRSGWNPTWSGCCSLRKTPVMLREVNGRRWQVASRVLLGRRRGVCGGWRVSRDMPARAAGNHLTWLDGRRSRRSRNCGDGRVRSGRSTGRDEHSVRPALIRALSYPAKGRGIGGRGDNVEGGTECHSDLEAHPVRSEQTKSVSERVAMGLVRDQVAEVSRGGW